MFLQDAGIGIVRLKSRVEADARFRVNDATGSWFEVWPLAFEVTNMVAGPEAEIRLAVARDEVTNAVKEYKCPAVTVRMEYDVSAGATNVNLYVYGKGSVSGTWGTEVYRTNGLAYSTNATLRMRVTSNAVTVVYNGTNYFGGAHGVDVSGWPNGGVCVVEAENRGGVQYVYLDNLKAWREGAMPVEAYEGSYTNAPDGMLLRAWPEDVAVEWTWSNARDTSTYVTNGRVVLVPGDNSGDKVWVNAQRDYQNDVRLDVAGTGGVAEVELAVGSFQHGYMKVGLMPEYYAGYLYDDWNGVALYLEMSRSGGNIKFRAYRTYGTQDARTPLAGETSVSYVDGQMVMVQVSTNWRRAYYGTNVVVDAGHGVGDFVGVYPNGIHVHVEYQSGASMGQVVLDGLRCRKRGSFGL